MKKVLLLIFLFSLSIVGYSQSCLPGWAYSSAIAVAPSTITLTDFQVKVVVNTSSLISAGQMKADGSDIRFVDANCNNVSYWIQSGINTPSTIIWIKVPIIPANTPTSVNLIYGNPSATAASSGKNTFVVFDDFESGSLSDWTFGNSSVWSIVNVGGNNKLRATNPSYGSGQSALLSSSFGLNEYYVDVDVLSDNSSIYGGPLFEYNNINTYYAMHYMPDAQVVMQSLITNGSANYGAEWSAPGTYNVYNRFSIGHSSTGNDVYFNDVKLSTVSRNFGTGAGVWAYGNGNLYYDNIRVRKFAVVAPVILPVSSLASSQYCENSLITVPYTATGGTFNAGNTFTAQLSDASGSFTTPIAIGSINSISLTGNISGTIPANTPSGSGYKIRVVSNNPAVTGSSSGTTFSVNTVPTFTSLTTPTSCINSNDGSITLNASGTGPFQYSQNNGTIYQSSNIINGLNAGNYNVVVKGNGGCVSTSQSINVGTTPDITPPTIVNPGNTTIASCLETLPNYATGNISDNCTPVANLIIAQKPAAGTAIAAGTTVAVTLTATDASGNSSSQTFNVTRPDITPVATNDAAVVCGGSSVNINVLSNDSHPQNAPLTVSDNTTPSVGTLVKNADNTFTYTAPANYSGPVTFTYTIKANDGVIPFSGNNHYYEYVASNGITWVNANAAASAKTYNGLKGYLVTVTSQAEQNFVNAKLAGTGWMGASDLAYEGTWRWVTGPEGLENGGLGRIFSDQRKNPSNYGNCSANTGQGVGGNYVNWQPGEPNDCGAYLNQYTPTDPNRPGEHYAHFYAGSGTWNDFPNNAGVQGYLVEYGGLEACTPVLTATATVTITVHGLPIVNTSTTPVTCAGGSDGSITVNASNGDTPYQYSKDGGATFQAGNVFAGLTDGNYSIVVKSATGCADAAQSVRVTTTLDVTPPVISNMPTNMVVYTDNLNCNTLVGFPRPTVTDNCGVRSLVSNNSFYNLYGFAQFSKGVNVVNFTATDLQGNQSSASFTITVVDNQAPIITGTPSNITKNVAAGTCGQQIFWNQPTASDNCPGVSLSGDHVPGDVFPIGTTLVTYTATDVAGLTTSVSFNVTVVDNEKPTITAPTDVTVSTDAGQCSASGVALGSPVFADNCTGATVASNAPATFAKGTTTVTWTVTDGSGNTATATQHVTVLDKENPTITAPSAVIANTNPGQCSATGVTLGTPSFGDNCPGTTVSNNAPSVFNKGITVVTWIATDASGNTATAMQNVTILDKENPTVTAPADVTVNSDPGQCAATNVALGTPSFGDNCPGATVSNNAPASFDKGLNKVIWTVTDASGNTSTAVQNVTVLDKEPPVLSSVSNITTTNDPNVCTAKVVYTAPTATDNCTGPTGNVVFNNTNSIVQWTVPAGVTKVNIKALGGRGGNSSPGGYGGGGIGGNGASIAGDFTVVPGQVLKILVAGHGGDNFNNLTLNTGGGGGSFVWNTSGNSLLLAAGGGSGNGTCNAEHGEPGLATLGGTGAGGNGGSNLNCGYDNGGGGGAGWLSNGTGTPANPNIGGISPMNGGAGAPAGRPAYSYNGTPGGFGGGAGGAGNCGGPGGGGGYNGGNGGDNLLCGGQYQHVGGGTSYNTGANQVNLSGVNNSDGQVIISYGGASATVAQTTGLPSGSNFPVGTTTNTFVATDLSGNTSTTSFTVTVNDTQKPNITAPAAIAVNNDAGKCGASVALGTPVTSDNCGVASVTNDAPAFFPVGTTTVTYTVTDIHNNTNTATQQVTVTDNEKPVIAGTPSNISQSNDLGSCGAKVSWTAATATDNCPGVTFSSDHQPGDYFPVGNTTVTYTAVDIHGNSSTTSFVITVNDTENPVIAGTPSNISQSNDLGSCGAKVSWTAATATDNCPGVIISSDHQPGDYFPVGNTTVTYTATDVHGNSVTTSFVVTINDTENPVIAGTPSNISQSNDLGSCGAKVSWTAATATDNCPGVIISSDHQPGDYFPVGNTTVTYTATDVHGNSVTTSFVVTINDTENPVIAGTPSNISQSNDLGSCGAKVSWTAATATDNCPGVIISSDHQPGDYFPVGNTTVTYTATDVHGNSVTTSFVVTINDTEKPVIAGTPSNISQSNDLGSCGAKVSWTAATATDNCPGVTISSDHQPGDYFPVGNTTVTYTAVDIHGNSSTTSFVITVNDTEKPVIAGTPSNISQSNDLGSCGAKVSWTAATATDNCPGVTISSDHQSGDYFPVGNTTVTYTATDVHGNSSTTSFVITVNDTEKPVIVGTPSNITQNNDPGSCGAKVSWTAATATDNCPGVTISSDHQSGDYFPVGNTTVTYTAVDIHGNKSVTSFIITVNDNEKPTIATTNVAVNNDKGVCAAMVTLAAPVTHDNCAVATVTNDHASTLFPVGTTVVNWTVTDIHGNSSATTQTVVVTDNEKPIVTVPANQTFCANYGGVTTYTIAQESATDNCGVLTTTYAVTGATTRTGTGSNASGIFNVGTSTIVWTVTDIHNNVQTASITVTINPLPVASYVTTNQDAFCNKLNLTASSTQPNSTYNWLAPGGASASAVSLLQLGNANADGVYTLYATAKGCRSEFPVTYTYAKQNMINNYTILGFKEVDLGLNNNVQTGSVGVTAVRGEAEMRSGVSIASPGAFLKAARIDIDGTVNIPIQVKSPANPLLPTMIYNTTSTRGLPYYQTRTATTGTVNGNYSYVYIVAGSNITLTGTIFGSITVEKGANVTFSSPVVNIGSLAVGGGKGDDHGNGGDHGDDNRNRTTVTTYSNVHFATNANVLVSSSVYFGLNTIVNAENRKVTFYVGHLRTDGHHDNHEDGHEGDYNDNDETSFTVVGGDTKVTANVYAPNGRLQVSGNDGDDDNWGWGDGDRNKNKIVPTAVTYMTGLFIANQVESDSRGVIWNSYDCGLPQGITGLNGAMQYVETEMKKPEQELTVKATPNPTTNFFMLNITSNDQKTEAVVRVVDGLGRPLNEFNHVMIGSTVTFGQAYAAGYYFAEVTQGTQHKVVKLIKGL